MEDTLVLIKPDAYRRGLTGLILARLEQRNLTIQQIRITRDEKAAAESHYPNDRGWLQGIGYTTIADYASRGRSTIEDLGTDDPEEIGRIVRGRLVDYLLAGPMVAVAVRGHRAIETVRKLIGHTIPLNAAPGTIRGDYSNDAPEQANAEGRPVHNLIHASGDPAEAIRELALWFPAS